MIITLDANILIAAVLSRSGPPAQIVARWPAGEFELVVSESLLDEVERGHSFEVTRKGKVIGRIEPSGTARPAQWDDIMAPVWEAQKRCGTRIPNPVLEERQRRRR